MKTKNFVLLVVVLIIGSVIMTVVDILTGTTLNNVSMVTRNIHKVTYLVCGGVFGAMLKRWLVG